MNVLVACEESQEVCKAFREYVITCSNLGDVYEGWYHTVDKHWIRHGNVVENITHWREIPKLPRMGG